MNNTRMGFSNPSRLPSSYRLTLENIPKVLVVGPAVVARLTSFDMSVEDLYDLDKLWSVFTPKEFMRLLKVMNYSDDSTPIRLREFLEGNFTAVSELSFRTDLAVKPTARSSEYIDQMMLCHLEELSYEQYLAFQFGTMPEVITHIGFKLINVEKDLFVAVLEEWDNTVPPKLHDYNVCVSICEKLFNIYGLRWVSQTKAFASFINLSQSSALSRPS